MQGNISIQEMTEKLKMESRRYAKRQITWFKKNKEIYWLDGQVKLESNLNIILRTNIDKIIKWEMINLAKTVANNKSNKKQKKNQNNIIGMILLGCVIALIIYIVYTVIELIIVPTDVSIVKNGIISSEESAIGYVIRDEEVVKGTNNQNAMVQIKVEGEKTASGEPIFRYSGTNEEELNNKINELNNQIQEAMTGQTDLFSGDIKAIENQIENKIEGLNLKNDIQEIVENKKDINTYITKKSKIAGDLSKAGSYINNLIQEREKYQAELKKASEYVKAPMSGVVSYRVDNMEEILAINNFESLNKEFLENLDLKTGQIVTSSDQTGKVINNYECYIATILSSKEAEETSVGKKVVLRLSTQDEVDATVSYISKQEDESYLIIFKIRDCVEKLIDYRKISFDVIWWSYEGLKVPKSAISYDNGLSYVVRNRGGYYNKILIEVLKENDNYCIVANYDDEDLKELGYTANEIYSIKKISIYDEILINPNLEEIE